MHDQLEQWLAATEGPERETWLRQARQHWQEQLVEAQKNKSFTFNKDIFRLLAVDLTLLDALQQAFVEFNVTKAIFNVHRPMMVAGEETIVWNPDLPPAVGLGLLKEIKRILGVSNVRSLHFFQPPFPVLITILGSSLSLETVFIVFSEGVPGTPEQLAAVASNLGLHQSTLTAVSLYGIRNEALRAICSTLSNASELHQLLVHGSTLVQQGLGALLAKPPVDPVRLALAADAAIFCRVLELPKLRKVDLDNIMFSSNKAAEVFCTTLGIWQLDSLKLGNGFSTPVGTATNLVKAMANSRVRKLRVNELGGPSDLPLFAECLEQSTRSTLEDLHINRPAFRFWNGELLAEPPGPYGGSWVPKVTRVLNRNRTRSQSKG